MSNCLYCYQTLEISTSWGNWLTHHRNNVLCADCRDRMERISGQRCLICSRPGSASLCSDCDQWKQLGEVLQFNHSVFLYNDWLKEIIAQWKYRGDYVLCNLFKDEFITTFEKVFSALKSEVVLVPIPLSDHRLTERGFNQAHVLSEMLDMPVKNGLGRKAGEKQSKKTRSARLKTANPYYCLSPIKQNVILIDDIYTTGTTIRQAASILLQNGCSKVYSYTLIRG